MTEISSVLLAVATELAELAKNSMPVLRKGEVVLREWFKDGIFYRETNLKGCKYVAEFNFRQRKTCRTQVRNANSNA